MRSRLAALLPEKCRSLPFLYISLLGLLGGYALLRLPIQALDNDLWYHLSGGRYIVQNHALPNHSFFSFLAPPRVRADYYWLFQLLTYALWSVSGYYGLLALRAALFLGTMALVPRLLARGRRRVTGWHALIFALCAMVLFPRALIVRPHLFSYFLIAAFLNILETGGRAAWALPVLALFWSNAHGIYFPVLLALCLVPLAERAAERLGWERTCGDGVLIPATLSAAAVLLTPNGLSIFDTIFTPFPFAGDHIREFRALSAHELLSPGLVDLVPTQAAAFGLLLGLAVLVALDGLLRRRLRLGPVLLCAAGAALLTKGGRFENEFCLLALPLLKDGPPPIRPVVDGALRGLAPALGGLLACLPALFLASHLRRTPRWPLSLTNLPEGVAAYLERAEPGGSVLNDPNVGGYLQWRLYPRRKIFMDMEVPFLFTEDDFFAGSRLFADADALRSILRRYAPDFMLVPYSVGLGTAAVAARAPGYAPVFFDDTGVLYADTGRHSRLAEAYPCGALDPNAFSRIVSGAPTPWSDKGALACLNKVLETDPQAGLANYHAAELRLLRGEAALSLAHAQAVVARYPEFPWGYHAQAQASAALGRGEEALRLERRAVSLASGAEAEGLRIALGRLCLREGRAGEAYAALLAAVDPFSPRTSKEDLFDLARAAAAVGRPGDARAVLGFFKRYRIDGPADPWTPKVDDLLASLGPSS